eukprot:scaffold1983_cov376-Prasinococcus_capsulatus_cf.AAC.6
MGLGAARRLHDCLRMAAAPARLDSMDEERAAQLRQWALAFLDWQAVLVELAARREEARRDTHAMVPYQQQIWALETLTVHAPLAHALGVGALMWELEDAAFRFIFPKSYSSIATYMAQHWRKVPRPPTRPRWSRTCAEACAAVVVPARGERAASVSAPAGGRAARGRAAEQAGRVLRHHGAHEKRVQCNAQAAQEAAQGGHLRHPRPARRPHAPRRQPAGRSSSVLPRPGGGVRAVEPRHRTHEGLHRLPQAWRAERLRVHRRAEVGACITQVNGYRSLHATVLVDNAEFPLPLELQVRSEQMHRFNEGGPAAHSGYKAGLAKPKQVEQLVSFARTAAVGYQLPQPRLAVEDLLAESSNSGKDNAGSASSSGTGGSSTSNGEQSMGEELLLRSEVVHLAAENDTAPRDAEEDAGSDGTNAGEAHDAATMATTKATAASRVRFEGDGRSQQDDEQSAQAAGSPRTAASFDAGDELSVQVGPSAYA